MGFFYIPINFTCFMLVRMAWLRPRRADADEREARVSVVHQVGRVRWDQNAFRLLGAVVSMSRARIDFSCTKKVKVEATLFEGASYMLKHSKEEKKKHGISRSTFTAVRTDTEKRVNENIQPDCISTFLPGLIIIRTSSFRKFGLFLSALCTIRFW